MCEEADEDAKRKKITSDIIIITTITKLGCTKKWKKRREMTKKSKIVVGDFLFDVVDDPPTPLNFHPFLDRDSFFCLCFFGVKKRANILNTHPNT